jgi:hypothetical protein
MSETTTSARLLARLRATPGDLAGLDAEVREAERHLERLRLLRELLAAVPAETNGAASGGASEEAPFAGEPPRRPRLTPATRPPTGSGPAGGQSEQAARAARPLSAGPLSAGELAGRMGLPSGRSLNGVLNGNPRLFRLDRQTMLWHLTDAGRELATAPAPDVSAASAPASPAPTNGTPS